MPSVNIIKYWSYPDILRQTKGESGKWDGIDFFVNSSKPSDYIVVHGHTKGPVLVRCNPRNIWIVTGEPPNEARRHWHTPPRWAAKLLMTDVELVGGKRKLGQSLLPWWVDKSFDDLAEMSPTVKTGNLCWITSNSVALEGHRYRMRYLDRIRTMPDLHLYGRGFRPVVGKWESLASYRYSIAFENHSNSMYFSEKLMDCFLAWTMPIYFGCSDLSKFFPRESFVQLDPENPEPIAVLKRIIESDMREKHFEAIVEARRRVLYDYNLFNLLAMEVRENERQSPSSTRSRQPCLLWDHTSGWRQLKPPFLNGLKDRILDAISSVRRY
ncbi:MAG: glycosyltransferase family 10 [Planctomycetota bacterium]|nr:glycosyltransferase family 10 [Planctomycetota bacterium]